MQPYIFSWQEEAIAHTAYRHVLRTAPGLQLVSMHLEIGETIPTEVHDLDQLIMVIAGEISIHAGSMQSVVKPGNAIMIPRGTVHEVRQQGVVPASLFTVYGPPEHKDGISHTRQSDAHEEHFDGIVSD